MKNTYRCIFGILLFLFVIGCGSSGDGSVSTKGTVYDDVVVGLDYRTKGFISKTNKNGEFNYQEGEVEFYLGNLYIGKIPKLN